MGKPKTLLEDLCDHALSCKAASIQVEHREGHHWIYLLKPDAKLKAASFPDSGSDAKEVRENLDAALRKPVRAAIGGRVWILRVAKPEDNIFRVTIEPAPGLDPSKTPQFTKKQGQYLASIYNYSKIHGRAPAESDLQWHFRTSPPTIHQMIKTLELNGLIERTPWQARSIKLLVRPEHLPILE